MPDSQGAPAVLDALSSLAPAPAALFGLATGGLWALTSLLVERTLQATPPDDRPAPTPQALNLWKNAIGLAVFGALALLLRRELPPRAAVLPLLVSGLAGFALGDALYFAALRRAGVQRAATLVLLHVPMAAVLGVLWLGEGLGLELACGMALTLAGVTWVVRARAGGEAPSARGGVLLALGAALAYALSIATGRHGLVQGDVVWGTVLRLSGAVLGALLVAPVAGVVTGGGRGARRSLAELVGPIARGSLFGPTARLVVVFAVTGMAFHHLALAGLRGAVAAVLFSTTPLFALPLERLAGRPAGAGRMAGTALGFAGVAWILFGGLRPEPVVRVVGALANESRAGSLAFDLARSGGPVHLAWTEPEEPAGHRLRVARLGPAGFGPAVTVARGDDWFVNWADFPRVAAREDGAMLASFLRRSGEGLYDYHALVAARPREEAGFLPPRRVHEHGGPGEHGFVSLASTGRAAPFFAVWLDGSGVPAGGATCLRAASVDERGVARDELLLDPRVCDCCQTSLALLQDGRLLAAYRDRAEDERRDVAFVCGRPGDPGSWSAPRPVHEDGWIFAGCPVNGPVAAAGGGEVVVAWYTEAHGTRRVLLARAGEETLAFAAPLRIDDGSPLGRVDLVLLEGGTAVVTWLERVEGVPGAEWRARAVTDRGLAGPSTVLAAASPQRTSGFGHLVLDAWTAGARSALVFGFRGAEPGWGVRTLRLTVR